MVRLDEIPAEARFDYWWQAVAESVVSVDASSDHASDFWAEMRTIDLGGIILSRVRCAAFEARRSTRRIRRSDPEAYQFSVIVSGRSGIEQEGRQTALTSTDLMIYDASRPFRAWSAHEEPGPWNGSRTNVSDGLIVHVPHSSLPLPQSMVGKLLAKRISGENGVGALLAGLLHQLSERSEELSAADLDRLGGVVVDLLTALLAHEIETDPSAYLADAGTVLVLRVQAFIERHLDQPDLTPAGVAAAHHVSLRHMQRLFSREGHTVGGWIQQRRLERCRRALGDPLMDHVPVTVIGARWGFSSDSHFNRVFRRAYGLPPAGYRRHLRGTTMNTS